MKRLDTKCLPYERPQKENLLYYNFIININTKYIIKDDLQKTFEIYFFNN